jgi:hypothetical protein
MGRPDLKRFAKNNQKRNHIIVVILFLITVLLTFKFAFNRIEAAGTIKSSKTLQTFNGGLKILKQEVTTVAKFYPYKAGKTYMKSSLLKLVMEVSGPL